MTVKVLHLPVCLFLDFDGLVNNRHGRNEEHATSATVLTSTPQQVGSQRKHEGSSSPRQKVNFLLSAQ